MANELLEQTFRIGQRVRVEGDNRTFKVLSIHQGMGTLCYAGVDGPRWQGSQLTLVTEYEPTERRVLPRYGTNGGFYPQEYRCETDSELATRHASERAAHDAA